MIEKVTGRSYAEELEQRVLDPLGLERTELPETRRLPDLDDAGYNPNLPWAAGAIVSNAQDVSRFYSALLSGRLLSGSSLATMKKTVAGIGLGIFPTELPCGRSWATTVTSSTTGRTSARARRATASPSSRSAGLDTYRPSGERCPARSLRLRRVLREQARGSPSSAFLAPAPARSTS